MKKQEKQDSEFLNNLEKFVNATEGQMDSINQGLIMIAFNKKGELKSMVIGNHEKLVTCLKHLLEADFGANIFRKLMIDVLNSK